MQSFLGLASFYRKCIKDFSIIASPLTECLKKWNFSWTNSQTQSFVFLKNRLSNTPVLPLSDFTQPFEVAIDACGRTEVVVSQHTHPIEYFSEKLSETRQKWSTYEQELYSLVKTLKV